MRNAILALVVLSTIVGQASAVFIVDDDFESYQNQQEFEGAWTPVGTGEPFSGRLSIGGLATSGEKSVENVGVDGVGHQQNQLTFTPTPLLGVGDQLIWSFDYYDKLPFALPRNNFASLQTSASPGTSPAGQKISLGLGGNQSSTDSGGNFYMAGISGYAHAMVDPDGGEDESAGGTTSGAMFKLNDSATAGLRGDNDGWRNLKLVISTSDGTTVDHEYYVNGDLAETVSGVGPNLQYSVIQLGSGLSNNNVGVFFDNMQLEFVAGAAAIPEAGSFAAVGVVSLLAGGAAWLRKRRANRAMR